MSNLIFGLGIVILAFGVPVGAVMITAYEEAKRTRTDKTEALALGVVVVLAMAIGWVGALGPDHPTDERDIEPRAIRGWAD